VKNSDRRNALWIQRVVEFITLKVAGGRRQMKSGENKEDEGEDAITKREERGNSKLEKVSLASIEESKWQGWKKKAWSGGGSREGEGK